MKSLIIFRDNKQFRPWKRVAKNTSYEDVSASSVKASSNLESSRCLKDCQLEANEGRREGRKGILAWES